MSSRISVTTTLKQYEANIIFALSTDNYDELKKLITESNINNVIDIKNGYTPIHYAIKFNNDRMIEYLLNMGANTSIRTLNDGDAFDISLKYQSKSTFSYEIKELKNVKGTFQKTISALEKKIITLETNNRYLAKSVDDMLFKIDNLKNDNKDLKQRNLSLETIHSELNIEHNEVLRSHKNIKRKYDDLEKSYDGVLAKLAKR